MHWGCMQDLGDIWYAGNVFPFWNIVGASMVAFCFFLSNVSYKYNFLQVHIYQGEKSISITPKLLYLDNCLVTLFPHRTQHFDIPPPADSGEAVATLFWCNESPPDD